MEPERWQRIEELYHSVLKVEEENRATFLKDACGDDEALRDEVESLLGHQESAEKDWNMPVIAARFPHHASSEAY